ncbi:hypothetical protein H9P43_008401 [Blastocladiella emersonii ATCC 22665]|nr:hypothetical protein H9P43_008401 [Blastocladiella emersonii ATCC 22665]
MSLWHPYTPRGTVTRTLDRLADDADIPQPSDPEAPRSSSSTSGGDTATFTSCLTVRQHVELIARMFRRVAPLALVMAASSGAAVAVKCGIELAVASGDHHRGTALRLRSAYDLVTWAVLLAHFRALFSLVYRRAACDRVADVVQGVGVAVALAMHAADLAGVGWDSPNVPDVPGLPKTLLGFAVSHVTYVWVMVGLLALVKARVWVWDRRDSGGRVPAQGGGLWSPVGYAVQAAFAVYYLSYWGVLSTVYLIPVAVATTLTISVFLAVKARRNELAFLYRHVDWTILFFGVAHIFRALNNMLAASVALPAVRPHFTWVLVTYRVIIAALLSALDDNVGVAFGVEELWLTYPLRFAEMLAVTTVSINSMTSLAVAAPYLALNLLIVVVKDAGLADDLRQYWNTGACLWTVAPAADDARELELLGGPSPMLGDAAPAWVESLVRNSLPSMPPSATSLALVPSRTASMDSARHADDSDARSESTIEIEPCDDGDSDSDDDGLDDSGAWRSRYYGSLPRSLSVRDALRLDPYPDDDEYDETSSSSEQPSSPVRPIPQSLYPSVLSASLTTLAAERRSCDSYTVARSSTSLPRRAREASSTLVSSSSSPAAAEPESSKKRLKRAQSLESLVSFLVPAYKSKDRTPSPPPPQLPPPRDPELDPLQLHYLSQVTRSEHSLIARFQCLLCYTVVLGVSTAMGVPQLGLGTTPRDDRPDAPLGRQHPSALAVLLVVFAGLEILVARVAAVVVLGIKRRRLARAVPERPPGPEGRRVLGWSVTGGGMANRLWALPLSWELWQTEMPGDARIRRLVVVASVFVPLVQYGAWS